jgi:phosphoglycerol transferase MdoB-like AlkP superfamily enzyme
MKNLLSFTTRIFLFWIFLFFIGRIFFTLYQWPIASKVQSLNEVYKALFKGYRLDVATASMLSLLPILLATIFFVIHSSVVKKILFILVVFSFCMYIPVFLGDAGLYREWNAKLNMQALEHFENPIEVLRILSMPLLVVFILLLSAFLIPSIWVYKKYIHIKIIPSTNISFKIRFVQAFLFFLLINTVGIIAIRGGLQRNPMNQSVAYFSKDILANDIAVNPLYSVLQDASIKSNIPDTSVYKFRSNEEAQNIIADDFLVSNDTSISIVQVDKPNLVFIFLESWSADNIGILGGLKNCSPQFDRLCNEGLLFTQTYANAYVSDQGIPAVLSAAPAVSRVAIINQPAKVHGLPCISEEFRQLGYHTSFLYGGELIFGNLKGYLHEKGFHTLIEQSDLDQYPKGSLGVHDEYMFPELLQQLNASKQPFMQCFFTTSSHMPYDFTPSDTWQSDPKDPEKKYTEACHYTDIHLGKFFVEAKKQAWYKNTLFVVVADHSHNTIRQWSTANPKHSHIPLLFLGGALKEEWKGKQWAKKVSQLDIASTILHQWKLPAARYRYSRNMLHPSTPSSAYYIFYGGQGYLGDKGFASMRQGSSIVETDMTDSTEINKAFAKAVSFQQLIYEQLKQKK